MEMGNNESIGIFWKNPAVSSCIIPRAVDTPWNLTISEEKAKREKFIPLRMADMTAPASYSGSYLHSRLDLSKQQSSKSTIQTTMENCIEILRHQSTHCSMYKDFSWYWILRQLQTMKLSEGHCRQCWHPWAYPKTFTTALSCSPSCCSRCWW